MGKVAQGPGAGRGHSEYETVPPAQPRRAGVLLDSAAEALLLLVEWSERRKQLAAGTARPVHVVAGGSYAL